MAFQLLRPEMLLLFIPLVLAAFFIIKKDFVRLPEDKEFRMRKNRWRRGIFISRFLILALLVIALAQPYGEVTRETSGNPRLTVLVDNSTSMTLFDTDFVPEFLERLEDHVPLKVRNIGSGDVSDIGEGVLANMERGDNILLITDGHNNEGANLGDVALFASQTNSTVSALELSPARKDVGVSILGPKKIVKDLNNTFLIRVTKPNVEFYNIKVTIDGNEVIDTTSNRDVIYLDHSFRTDGYHEITAEVSVEGGDHFSENNVFYKAVNVIEKPKILYVTEKDSPLEVILRELYEVTKSPNLPPDLSPFYAVIINDMPAAKFRNIDAISNFLIDGNGMVVFGGFNAYDRGGYKNSVFEQFLPVKVGTAERTFSDNTVVIAIDRSSGGGKCRTIIDTVLKTKKEVCSDISYTDVIKAQAVELIGQFDETNKVGAIAFDTDSYLVEPIDSLYNSKERMLDKIKRIQPGGNTLVSKGILGGYNLLSNTQGDKYLILLTDGVTWQGDQEESAGLAASLNEQGIKLITVGIGRSVHEEFLRASASYGGGFYVSGSNKGRLKVLFGDPEKKDQGDDFSMIILNTGHFITNGLDPDAVMKGYNQVLPRSSSELLISTDSGEPALTTWRYGLGKVAAWTVFSGGNLGELLSEGNSVLLSRTVNWAIGDPERKKAYFVNVEDGRLGRTLDVEVRSDRIPSAEGLQFVKIEESLYEAEILPDQTGFGTVLEAKYAVNNPREYDETGFSPRLQELTSSTGGNLFKPDEIENIVEYVRSVSRKTVTEKTSIIWPFLMAAIIIFLMEIIMRRISENRFLSR